MIYDVLLNCVSPLGMVNLGWTDYCFKEKEMKKKNDECCSNTGPKKSSLSQSFLETIMNIRPQFPSNTVQQFYNTKKVE